MLKTHRNLNETLKIFKDFNPKINRQSTYTTLVQNFNLVLTDTIAIQIINQQLPVDLEVTMMSVSQNESCMESNSNLDNDYIDRLILAFKQLKFSFKTFFKNIY
jgi:hypothetical protein